MPVMRFATSMLAGVTVDNVLQGSVYEFLAAHSLVEIGVVSVTAAGVFGDVRATITSGTDVLADNYPCGVRAGTGLNLNDDPILQDAALAGERLKVTLRNTSGITQVADTFVRITPR